MILIGNKIRFYREQKGYTQEYLAEIVNISPNYLSALERNVKIPSLNTFIAITDALNISADALLSDSLASSAYTEYNRLSRTISELPLEEQLRIFHVMETMINDAKRF